MTISAGIEAGKTDRDENFPVASFLLAPRLRAPILSFYRFARAADDIADHAALSERDEFAGLDFLERTLLGKSDKAKAALPLRSVLAEHRLAPTHPLDLLTAFRADVSKRRYAIGTSSCTIAAIPPIRSGALSSIFTARTVPFGPIPIRCVLPCRSSIICKIAPRIIANLIASTSARCHGEVWREGRGTRRPKILASAARLSEVDCR